MAALDNSFIKTLSVKLLQLAYSNNVHVGGVVKKVGDWLQNTVNICNDKMGTPYNKCQHQFHVAYHECRCVVQ